MKTKDGKEYKLGVKLYYVEKFVPFDEYKYRYNIIKIDYVECHNDGFIRAVSYGFCPEMNNEYTIGECFSSYEKAREFIQKEKKNDKISRQKQSKV